MTKWISNRLIHMTVPRLEANELVRRKVALSCCARTYGGEDDETNLAQQRKLVQTTRIRHDGNPLVTEQSSLMRRILQAAEVSNERHRFFVAVAVSSCDELGESRLREVVHDVATVARIHHPVRTLEGEVEANSSSSSSTTRTWTTMNLRSTT